MIEVKAPGEYRIDDLSRPILFAAGSIEMGAAEKWQDRLVEELKDIDVLILNPRRDDWDSSWVQSIDNPQFKEQVLWELEGQETAEIITMFFSPQTKSPISLLELGLLTHSSSEVIVYCPQDFWRKGNVDIVCERHGLFCTDHYENWISRIKDAVINT